MGIFRLLVETRQGLAERFAFTQLRMPADRARCSSRSSRGQLCKSGSNLEDEGFGLRWLPRFLEE